MLTNVVREEDVINRCRAWFCSTPWTFDSIIHFSHHVWGRRRLAYEIDHKSDGSHHLLGRSSTARRHLVADKERPVDKGLRAGGVQVGGDVHRRAGERVE